MSDICSYRYIILAKMSWYTYGVFRVFPLKTPQSEHQIEEAKIRDAEHKATAKAKPKAFRWRAYENFIQGGHYSEILVIV